jgi:hypothetical protein
MNVLNPVSTNPLEQLNKAKPVEDKQQENKQDFAAILNSEIKLNNGGGGHPLNPKIKPK